MQGRDLQALRKLEGDLEGKLRAAGAQGDELVQQQIQVRGFRYPQEALDICKRVSMSATGFRYLQEGFDICKRVSISARGFQYLQEGFNIGKRVSISARGFRYPQEAFILLCCQTSFVICAQQFVQSSSLCDKTHKMADTIDEVILTAKDIESLLSGVSNGHGGYLDDL